MNLNEYKGGQAVERMRDTIASKRHDLGNKWKEGEEGKDEETYKK